MRALCRLAALLSFLTAPVAAQDSAGPMRLRGVTLDHWGPEAGAALLRPTFRVTNLNPGRVGSDFALVMFPDGISLRPLFIAAGLQAGVAYRLAAGPASLLLKGGGAGIVSAGAGRLPHLVPGAHLGLGLLIPVDAKSLLRADLTRHLYTSNGRTVGLWSFGVGFAAPRRRAGRRAGGRTGGRVDRRDRAHAVIPSEARDLARIARAIPGQDPSLRSG